MTELDLVYIAGHGNGWGPIDALADLTARSLSAELISIPDRGEVSVLRKLASLLPQRRSRRGRALLVLASTPAQLAYAARWRYWIPGYTTTAAWIIDSFWSERISRFATTGRHFDHLFITDGDLLDEWRRLTGTEIHWAPWGADTLAVDVQPKDRPVDLLRLGRQPKAWDDDATTAEAAGTAGVRFAGRPRAGSNARTNMENVRRACLNTKIVLAFSNRVSPGAYTHPTREYLTGRWMDALAAGASVAGVAPTAANTTLWPGATVEISATDIRESLSIIKRYADEWTPNQSLVTHREASRIIDWRHRIHTITQIMNLTPSAKFESEISQLHSRESATSTPKTPQSSA